MNDNFLVYDFDDDIIEAVQAERTPKVKIYRPDETAVVIGKGGKPEKELQLDAINLDSVNIYRRYGGGCSVVIDPGNAIVSAVVPTEGIGSNRRYFRILTEWLKAGLRQTGFEAADNAGTSDIAIGGKKISGSCIYRTRDYLYYSAALLIKPDKESMDRWLKHPPREPEYREGREHGDFVGSLGEFRRIEDIEGYIGRLRQFLNEASLARALDQG